MMYFLMMWFLFFMYLVMFIMGLVFLKMNLIYYFEWNIYSMNSLDMSFIFFIDYMSLIFISVVFLISSMVMLYCVEYMVGDMSLIRFFYLVVLFIMSMVLMIFSPNLMSILLGWDGLGLISYCLVVYYQNDGSFNSGMLTILCNRIGDVGLLMALSLSMYYGSWNLMVYKEFGILIMIMLLLASITKSAQIPFSSWLPAAMAAPTPVSALVHSSTLVTAGVYLMIRFNFMLIDSSLNCYLLFLSSLTMLMSGFAANFEYDLKKIIALSTLSQLGLMFSVLSLGYSMLSFFHLLIHALFKSLLFLCAGVLIHCFGDSQDIRIYGNFIKMMPFLNLNFLVSNLCLCGFPFLSGFYSKDYIMEMILMSNMNLLSFIMLMISTVLTVSYTVRLVCYLYFGEYIFYPMNLIEESFYMNWSMCILLMSSIFSGSMLNWLMFNFKLIILEFFMKMLIFFMIFMGTFLGIWMYLMPNDTLIKLGYLFSTLLFLNMLYKDNYLSILSFSINLKMSIEAGWLEYMNRLFLFDYYLMIKIYFILESIDMFKILKVIFLVVIILILLIW